ncbi:MAG: ATPase [Bacteroidales bacterium]|nr:ATPase [Bacteroidales bacterium]
MILIADSGSTKTRWALAHDVAGSMLTTQGLNPHLTDADTISRVLQDVCAALPSSAAVETIHFYGAGCGTAESQCHMSQLLGRAFPAAHCWVEGDMLGACRAACGANPGLVGILGTGSNLCYFDGHRIALQRFSTGYILGDEGSGNHIGRQLLKDALEDRMPHDISLAFHQAYPLSNNEFISRLYSQPYPNRFLASFASFAAQHQQHPYIEQVLNDCFGAFLEGLDFYKAYRHLPLHLVGGITHSFQSQLRHVAQAMGYSIASMVADPLPSLVRYHLL